MKFKNRKLYPHGQNTSVYTIQLPKLVCEDMGLTKEDLIDIDYDDGIIVISKAEKEEPVEQDTVA